MKAFKTCALIVLCTVLAAGATTARAGALAEFSAGVAFAYGLHEGGHELAARATGTRLSWNRGNLNQFIGFKESRELSTTSGALLYSSGLLTQAITSEVILDTDIDKNANFVRGVMAWNIINPIRYALDFWLFHSAGDLTGLEHYTDKPTADLFAVAMTALALNQGYRFLQTQDWAPSWARHTTCDITAGPAGNDGFQLTVTIEF